MYGLKNTRVHSMNFSTYLDAEDKSKRALGEPLRGQLGFGRTHHVQTQLAREVVPRVHDTEVGGQRHLLWFDRDHVARAREAPAEQG